MFYLNDVSYPYYVIGPLTERQRATILKAERDHKMVIAPRSANSPRFTPSPGPWANQPTMSFDQWKDAMSIHGFEVKEEEHVCEPVNISFQFVRMVCKTCDKEF